MTNNRGVTLLALVVAVAVIGVLAVIAVPQFSMYRQKAAKVKIRPHLSDNSLKIVDAMESTLDIANYAFKTPTSMDYKEEAEIELKISKKQTGEELKKSFKLSNRERTESGETKVSNKVQATLASTDFDVKLLSPDTQLVSSTNTFVWLWKIKPLHHGNGSLHLSVNAILDEGPYVLRALDKDITITITMPDRFKLFVKNNWEYLKWGWTAIFVPIILYLWNLYKKKRTSTLPPSP